MMLKLGKTPARTDAMALKLSNYLDVAELPTIPNRFGNLTAWNSWQWGMLANDTAGCCVWSGFGHQCMMWNATGGITGTAFTNEQILGPGGYGSTGYNPNDPSTDNGTDMVQACQFWKDNGFYGHRIVGFAEVKPSEIAAAAFIFGSVGVGIEVTQAQMDQFDHAEPWDHVRGSRVLGGHYVPVIGRNSYGDYLCITWGRLQAMTPQFIKAQCDEAVCQLSNDWLNVQGTVTPRGLGLADLLSDMQTMSNSL